MSELERRLRTAAPHYSFPPTPSLAGEVRARLPRRRPFPWRRTALAVAVALVAAAAAIALTPAARSAFLDWIDAIPGVKIARVEKLPRSELLPAFDFGRPVTLEEARREARFPVRLPDGVGEPTGVYLDRDGAGQAVVTVAYEQRLMVTEWRERLPLFYKLIAPGTRVDDVRVGSSDGVWVTGGDHAVFYLGTDSLEYSRNGRLAGRVLLWDRSGIGYRLEGRLSRERALELARSTTP
jgi:hypothetical protein